MTPPASAYQLRRAESERLKALAHEAEFLHDVSDAAEYVGAGIGLNPGQATVVTLHVKGEHATVGGVHVALKEDGTFVVAVEAEPGVEIEMRRVIRRPRWRFYDFWRWDSVKCDNEIRPQAEWPAIEEVPAAG